MGGRRGMDRYAWVLEVRPGYEEEYRRRHEEIWPKMVEALRSAGIRNYSIFREGVPRHKREAAVGPYSPECVEGLFCELRA